MSTHPDQPVHPAHRAEPAQASEAAETSVPAPHDVPARTALWTTRVGPRQYTAHNGRGGVINIDGGDGDGAFTPGELLKLALAACAGLSTDIALARRLGPDFNATVHVQGLRDDDQDRYPALSESFEVDLSSLEPDARERLIALANRTVENKCTVGRTLQAGVEVGLQFVDSSTGHVVLDAPAPAPNLHLGPADPNSALSD